MACYKLMQAWYSKEVNTSGKRSLVFTQKKALQPDEPLEIPCGQCVGCRLERSRQWAIRCLHEASLHENNCFLTLTFNRESLEKRDNPWTLDVRDFQLFMKRFRKKYGNKIRFFHCGEYGDKNKRPHYHAIIFNFDFNDKKVHSIKDGIPLYKSESLSKLWPHGFGTIGSVTFESAAYVARYIMKKRNGDAAEHHYVWLDETTGELRPLKPEYITMSRRPGIGTEWYKKYNTDIYPHDFVIINGKKMRPPKFYDKLLEKSLPYLHDDIKFTRSEQGEKNAENNTRERLDVRHQIQLNKLNLLKRNLQEN